MTCIRPNGQLHVLLAQSGEIVFVPLESVRAAGRKAFDMRLLPATKDVLSVLTHLLMNATAEMESVREFEEDQLREQHVKLLQVRAARAVLAHRDCLRRMLTSPVASTPIPQNSIPVNIPLQKADLALVFNLLQLCSILIGCNLILIIFNCVNIFIYYYYYVYN